MGKNNKPQPQASSKSKPIKSAKPKNKEMFTELKTHQENKINVVGRMKSQNQIQSQMIDEDDEFQYSEPVKGNQGPENVEQICAMVHNLLSKNKISAKNAFEVPLIDLEKLQEFSKISETQNGWKKVSSTLENDSKIYSYRVDAIHSIAYKIINTMARNQDEEPDEKNINEVKKEEQKNSLLDLRVFPITDEIQMSTSQLEKNIENINAVELQRGVQFNPNFERTKRQFDQGGVKGILLNTIKIDSNLELSLNETGTIKPKGLFEEAIPVKVDELREPLDILRQIQTSRKNAYHLMNKQFVTASGYQLSWRKIRNCEFDFEMPDEYENTMKNSNQIDLEDDGNPNDTFVFKKVEDVVKMRGNKKKNQMKNISDVAADGISWLSDIDRKMLGIGGLPSMPNNPTIKKTQQIKVEKNEDDIDFNPTEELDKRGDVFTDQTMESCKGQYAEEIEEKHLLPLKPFNKFKVEQIMTLREEPKQILQNNPEEMDDNYNQILKEREQVDLRRQQMSIRDSKDRMRAILGKTTDFFKLCAAFDGEERGMSVQLCFLTVLHLANENNLALEQIDDYNFKIK